MSMLKGKICAAPLLAALLLAGCGGGDTTRQSQQLGLGVAVGEPNGGAPVASEFIKMAQDEECTDIRNRLFVIDGKQVYWDRMGNCPDMAYAQRLFGATPQALLCETADSIGGPRTFCANDTARALFDTIQKNRELPDLGLSASGHKVEPLPFLPKSGTEIAFQSLVKANFSGVTSPKNVVIKDEAAWEKLWNEHNSNTTPAPPLPKVDFARQMVLGVFQGYGGCGDMSVTRVLAKDGKLVVEYELRALPADMACIALVTEKSQMIVVDRTDAPVEFVALKVTGLLAVMVDQTTRSQISTPRELVVKDQPSWEALWAEHAGKGVPAPAVDFGRQMVVGVFLGNRENGCYSTSISSVSSDGKQITVRHVDKVPGLGVMCTLQITAPAALVAISRSDLAVVFAKEVEPLR